MLTGWQTVNGKTYFFDAKKGYMYTGWITTAAGNKYYFWNDGAVRAGFHKVNNVYYCFSEKGKMYKNCFRKNGNSTYYLQANGTMAKGRLKVKGSWYSFNRNTGQLVTSGWYKETDGSYYYAGSNGKLVNGFINQIPITVIFANLTANYLQDGKRSMVINITSKKQMAFVMTILF